MKVASNGSRLCTYLSMLLSTGSHAGPTLTDQVQQVVLAELPS